MDDFKDMNAHGDWNTSQRRMHKSSSKHMVPNQINLSGNSVILVILDS